MSMSDNPTVVLVHGGFVDGSGWQGVHGALTGDGYDVSVVQNPTVSLADDVAVTKRAIDAAGAPVILVGHSYGGAVISGAADAVPDRITALVYLDAFLLEEGEGLHDLLPDEQREMQLILAVVAQRFRPRLAPGWYVVPKVGTSLRAKGGMWMIPDRA